MPSAYHLQGTVTSMLGDGMKYQVWSMPQSLQAAQKIRAYTQKAELTFNAVGIWGQIVVLTRVVSHYTTDPLLWGCPMHCRMFGGIISLPLEVASSQL